MTDLTPARRTELAALAGTVGFPGDDAHAGEVARFVTTDREGGVPELRAGRVAGAVRAGVPGGRAGAPRAIARTYDPNGILLAGHGLR